MKKLMPLLFLFACTSMPNSLPLMLEELNISFNTDAADVCSMQLVEAWEKEILLDEQLKDDVVKYLRSNNITAIELQTERKGIVTCDFANIAGLTELDKCDPATLVKEGSMITPEPSVEIEAGHISVTSYSAQVHRNEYIYDIFEESDENKITILDMLKHEDGYLSFEKINEYSLSFPIQISERDYFSQFKCGDLVSIKNLLLD